MFVEFFDSGTPAYYLKDCRYTGRRLVQVKKLPTTRLYLTTCRGAHDDLGFSVYSMGHGQRQPALVAAFLTESRKRRLR